MICKPGVEENPVKIQCIPLNLIPAYSMGNTVPRRGPPEPNHSAFVFPIQQEMLEGGMGIRMSLEFERVEEFFRNSPQARFWTSQFSVHSFLKPVPPSQIDNGVSNLFVNRITNSENEVDSSYFRPNYPLSPPAHFIRGNVPVFDQQRNINTGHSRQTVNFDQRNSQTVQIQQPLYVNNVPKAATNSINLSPKVDLIKSQPIQKFLFNKNELNYLQEILDAKPSSPYALLGVLSQSCSNILGSHHSPSISEKETAKSHKELSDDSAKQSDCCPGQKESNILKIELPSSYKALIMQKNNEPSQLQMNFGVNEHQKSHPSNSLTKLCSQADDSNILDDSFVYMTKTSHKKIAKTTPGAPPLAKRPRGRPRKTPSVAQLNPSMLLSAQIKLAMNLKMG